MLSAIVLLPSPPEASPPPEAIVRTLAALVPAAIEGVVRDVVIAASARSPDLVRIGDHAGCDIVAAEAEALLGAACEKLKAPAILVLRAGRVPEQGFVNELADLAAYGPQQSALLREASRTLLTRLFPGLAPAAGVVAPRDMVAQTRRPSVRALARALNSPIVLKARMLGDA